MHRIILDRTSMIKEQCFGLRRTILPYNRHAITCIPPTHTASLVAPSKVAVHHEQLSRQRLSAGPRLVLNRTMLTNLKCLGLPNPGLRPEAHLPGRQD